MFQKLFLENPTYSVVQRSTIIGALRFAEFEETGVYIVNRKDGPNSLETKQGIFVEN